MDAWINLFSTAGVGAVLAWYLYYSTTTLLPRSQAKYQATLDKLISDFREELASERATREPLRQSIVRLSRALNRRPCLKRCRRPASTSPPPMQCVNG